MFDAAQKEAAISEAVSIPVLLGDHLQGDGAQKARVFIQALVNYIEKTSPLNPSGILADISLDTNPSAAELSHHMQRLLVHMVTVGIDDTLLVKIYTTGDVARFFGVTVATVNNWIQQGRITGVEKGPRFKQARIPETAMYSSVSGERVTIKEAAQLYDHEQRNTSIQPLTPAQELQEILKDIVFYEKKYGGEYKDTLAQKSELNSQEERDAAEWRFLLKSVEEFRT
jgi:hypothetical protein